MYEWDHEWNSLNKLWQYCFVCKCRMSYSWFNISTNSKSRWYTHTFPRSAVWLFLSTGSKNKVLEKNNFQALTQSIFFQATKKQYKVHSTEKKNLKNHPTTTTLTKMHWLSLTSEKCSASKLPWNTAGRWHYNLCTLTWEGQYSLVLFVTSFSYVAFIFS